MAISMRVDEARERRDALDQQWYRVLDRVELTPVLIPNHIGLCAEMSEYLRSLSVCGAILTGGNDLGGVQGAKNPAVERDQVEGALIDACESRGLPVLGVCRGFQKLVLHHGGQPSPLTGHVAKPHPVHLVGDSAMPLKERREVNSFHDFGLAPEDLGPHMIAIAHSPDGFVEAAVHRELPHWGIMWHPERSPYDPADLEIIRSLLC
ncbi:MAG: glutamine amidotransferase [bacterium]|nr:glutamine amidotransferase [bacterium]